MENPMARTAKSKSDQDTSKIKLIIICMILLLAMGWIAYFQFAPRGPSRATGARLEEIEAQTAAEKQRLMDEQPKDRHATRVLAPMGA
jgi:flagellar basal body-associated protein FliL